LPARHLWAGFAEALKHGLIADAAYWKDLSGHYHLLEASGNEGDEFRKRLILRSVEIKWDIVSDDPHEQEGEKS
jgi:3-dehydroquinate synthase